MWRPTTRFNPPTLNDVTDWTNDRIRAGISTGRNITQNTIDDIRGLFGSASDCLAAIDRSRLDLTHRGMEYSNRIIQESLEPLRDWMASFGVRWPRRPPNPKLYLVDNVDRRVMFSSDGTRSTGREVSATDFASQKLVLLIHGLNTDPDFRSAYNYWEGITQSVRSLRAHLTDPDYAFVVLSWDSEIRSSDLRLFGQWVATGFGNLGYVQLGMMFGFDEFVRRAHIVGDFVANVLAARAEPTLVFTHSLGAECVSYGIQQLTTGPTNTQWIDFQAAVPQNAWDTNTGRYRRVSELFANGNPHGNRHVVVHSELDIILTLLYNAAVLNVPAGLFGPNRNQTKFHSVSVVEEVRENHGPHDYLKYIDVGNYVSAPFD